MPTGTLTFIVCEGWDDAQASRAVREAGFDAIYVDNATDLLAAMRDGFGRIDLLCAAYAWMDCMLGALAQRIVSDMLPCGPVNRAAAATVGPDVRAAFATDVDLTPLHAECDRATFADWRAGWERVRAA